jgi:hypothetical protein
MKTLVLKKLLFLSLLVLSSFNLKADDSDPITWGIIAGTASVAGTMIGSTAIMSNTRVRENRRTQDNTNTNTRDNTRFDNTNTNTRR